jgi:hypothetical protein
MFRLSQIIAHRGRHVEMQTEPRDAQLAREAMLARRRGRGARITEMSPPWPLVALWLAISGGRGANAQWRSVPSPSGERRKPCLQTECCEAGCAAAT